MRIKTLSILCPLLFSVLSVCAQEKSTFDRNGVYFGFNAGTWAGDSDNKVLGSPFMGGMFFEYINEKNAYAFTFDIYGNISETETLNLKYRNGVVSSRWYSGAQIGLEYSRQLYAVNRLSLEALSGLGYGQTTYFNPREGKDDVDQGSLYVSPGISIRVFVTKNAFLRLKGQYHVTNYDLGDDLSTSFKGNYFMTKLSFGW